MSTVDSSIPLLYLGFGFPEQTLADYPEINPAGNAFERQMVRELEKHFEMRRVSILPVELPRQKPPEPGKAAELTHLLLVDKAPELIHRWQSLARLKKQWAAWRSEGWVPQVILVYNFSPIYNAFLRWLKFGKVVVLLADSTNLGRKLSFSKRFRYRFKPFVYLDEQMLRIVHGCVSLSDTSEKFFAARRIPWMWMPGACSPERAKAPLVKADGPIDFGYFGSLAGHSGLHELLDAFCASAVPGFMHISGYGKQVEQVAQRCKQDPRLKFHGFLPNPEDCLEMAQACDVLVNPRPLASGNENNFPSKLFDYALTGRAILTTGFSGAKIVLGPGAFYLDEKNLKDSLVSQLEALARKSGLELAHRGRLVQERVITEYSWGKQGGRIAEFLSAMAKGEGRILQFPRLTT